MSTRFISKTESSQLKSLNYMLQNNLGLLKNRGFIETPYRDLRYAVSREAVRRIVFTAPHPSLKVVKLLIFCFP